MKKTQTKLIVAILSLVIAFTLATATTFAWFSMNSEVQLNNISSGVTSQGDLFISTEKITDVTKGKYEVTLEANSNVFNPVTAYEKPTDAATKAISLKNLKNADDAASGFSFTLHFASVSQYDVYLLSNTLKSTQKYTDNADMAVLEKAMLSTAYYYTKGANLYEVRDFVIDGANVASAMVNGVSQNAEADHTMKLEEGLVLTFTVADGKVTAISAQGADTTIEPGTKITADALNALRIGFVVKLPDASVSRIIGGKDGGFSAYTNANMAHLRYNAIASSVGAVGVPAAFRTEALQTEVKTFDELQNTKLFTLGRDTAVTAENGPRFAAEVTVTLWLEGADEDCLASVANQIISGSLNFNGVYVEPQA